MADNQEDVVYSFEGDVSSLRQATQEAISLLDKFDVAMKNMATKDTFSASKTSATNFQRVVGGLIKQVNSLTTSLNSAGASIDTAMPDGAAIVQTATKDLADVLDYLDSSSTVASSDLKLLTEVLQETKGTLDSVTARAQILATSLKPLEQLQVAQTMQASGQAAQQAQRHYEAAAASGFRVQDAYVAANKSAADSAAVFLRASRAAEDMQSVESVIRRIQTEMNLFGVTAKQAWDAFAQKIDPTVVRLQSFTSIAAAAFGRVKFIVAQVSAAYRHFSTEVADSNTVFKKVSKSLSSVGSSLKSLGTKASTAFKSFSAGSKIVSGLKGVLVSLTGIELGRWFQQAVKQSIDFTENLNLFKVAMGDAVEVGKEFIAQMSEIYGMDPSNLMRYAGNFYQLADAIDMPDEAASKLSLSLVKATNDIASLFNVPIDTVFSDLSSGMQGMSRAVRKYGMDIRTTTLQQTALSLGIKDNVENMSEANRQGLRFITMMRQARNASGDFAETIEEPANQLRIFTEQMAQLGRAIGDLVIEPLTVVIQHLNGFVMALRMIISFVGSVLGLVKQTTDSTSDASQGAEDYIEGLGSAATDTTKKLKAMLAPFDELNVLSSQPTSTADAGTSELMDPAIVEAITNTKLELEQVRMKALDVRDAILSFLGFKIENGTILSWKPTEFLLSIGTLESGLSNIVVSIRNSVSQIGESLSRTYTEHIQPFISTVVEAFAPMLDTVGSLWGNLAAIISGVFESIASVWTASIEPALGAFFDALSAIMEIATELWKNTLDPVFRNIGDKLEDLWINVLSPICESIISIVAGIIEVVLLLWNGVLAPLVNFIATLFGPTFASVFNGIIDIFWSVLDGVGQVVKGILEILDGLITVIAGVFTGNWERAWQGVVKSFTGAWDVVAGIVKTVFNSVISIINGVLSAIAGGINGIINSINKLKFTVPEWVPGIGGEEIGFNLKNVTAWQIPMLASGAVVTSPTLAMVGEGKYDEAVVPLGNSPQMKELVSSIADAVHGAGSTSDQPIVVHLYLDGREVLNTVVRQARSEAVRTGINPLLGG